MADILPGIPSVPGDETSWSNFVDQFETLKKGDIPLSLTNWDTGSAQPAVEAGSALEIAGATYRFTSEQEIDDEAGVVAGTVYVVVKTNDPNVNSATPYFSSVAPIWRADLNGWYDAGGANRYTGHFMIWDGGSSYTGKSDMYGLPAPNLKLGGTLDVIGDTTLSRLKVTSGDTWEGVYQIKSIPAGDTLIIEEGFYVSTSSNSDLTLEITISPGTWVVGGPFSGCVVSDGVNYRVKNNGASSASWTSRKIW